MNRKVAIGVGVSLLVVALLIGRFRSHLPHLNAFIAQNQQPVSEGKSASSSVSSGFGKYLRAPRMGYGEQLRQKPKLPAGCIDYFDQLQGIDFLGEGAKSFTYQTLPMPGTDCVGEFVAGFNRVQQEYLKECRPSGNLSEKLSDACMEALFMMRAMITRYLLQDKPLDQITDLFQLTDLAFAEMSDSTHASIIDPSKVQAVAQRMLELDPQFYGARKIDVLAEVVGGLITNHESASFESQWIKAEQSLAQAKALRENDESLRDAEIAIQTRGMNIDRSAEYAQKLTSQNQNDDRGWYLMSYAQWKQGNHAASVESLKRAISLNPNNGEYTSTLADISKPNAGPDAFKVSLMIKMDMEDFSR